MCFVTAKSFLRWIVGSWPSQSCSDCGPKDGKKLSVREWICSCCNTYHERDKNAAINLRNESLRMKTVGTAEKDSKNLFY